jgi:hypothetical protein
MEAIFEFVSEKYEANAKGLLPFRTPTADEKAITQILPPAGRVEPVVRQTVNPPPAIEYVDDGLNDINQINKDWDTFAGSYTQFTCEKKSETEFVVCSCFGVELMTGYFLKTTATAGDYNHTRTVTVKSYSLYYLHIIS